MRPQEKILSLLSRLLPPVSRSAPRAVVCALSGGPDSVALLLLLEELAPSLALRLAAVHVNYGLRGKDSAADEAFVRALCRARKIPLLVVSDRSAARRAAEGKSFEDAARAVRLRAYGRAAGKFRARFVALGHHRDDQVETFFLRLLRGAGVTGLSSILPAKSFGRLKLLRPLLALSREEILAYLRSRGQKFRTDRTNRDTRLLRNRVRHELLPLLEKNYSPALRPLVVSTCRQMQMLRDWSDATAEKLLSSGARAPAPGKLFLDRAVFAREADFPVCAALKNACQKLRGPGSTVDFSDVERLLGLLRAGKPDQASLPGLRVFADASGLFLCRRPLEAATPCAERAVTQKNRLLRRKNLTISFVLRARAKGQKPARPNPTRWSLALAGRPLEFRADLDADKIPFPVVLRGFLPGDRLRPTGCAHRVKVKDVLQSLGVPLCWKPSLPLLAAPGGSVLWVPGHRVEDGVKVTAATRRVWSLSLRLIPGL